MRRTKKQELLTWYIKLISAFSCADWRCFHDTLFSQVAEGWWFYIVNARFDGLSLHHLPGRFLAFKKCSFRNTEIVDAQFMPCRFESCDMRDINMESVNGYVEFIDCDLRGAKFNNETILFPRKRTDKPSSFKHCLLDEPFKLYLANQGIRIE